METQQPPIDELLRVYQQHQKELEKRRQYTKTPKRKEYARKKAQEFYEENREAILKKRREITDEKRLEKNKKALERYYKMREADPNWKPRKKTTE